LLVRQLTKQLFRPLNTALSGIASAITKVFIDLSPTSNGFYSLGTDSVLTTAYKLGISTVLPTASTTYALYGRASSATDYLKILSSGYLSLDVDGTVVTSTVLATKDSEYREYSVTLSGNDFIFKENTTVISTVTNATAAAKTLTLNLIGKSNAGEFYLGILADPIMGSLEFELDQLTANTETVDGVTVTYQNIGTGTDVRDTYDFIGGDYIGSNVVPQSISSLDWQIVTNVTQPSIGQFDIAESSPSFSTVLRFDDKFDIGALYETSFTVSNLTVTDLASLTLRISAGGTFSGIVADGTYTERHVTSGNNFMLANAREFNGTVTNWSIRKVIEIA
jgi:hypothetical protein